MAPESPQLTQVCGRDEMFWQRGQVEEVWVNPGASCRSSYNPAALLGGSDSPIPVGI